MQHETDQRQGEREADLRCEVIGRSALTVITVVFGAGGAVWPTDEAEPCSFSEGCCTHATGFGCSGPHANDYTSAVLELQTLRKACHAWQGSVYGTRESIA